MSTNHSSAEGGGLALLPCPFCGGEPRLHAHAGNVWVECESCCAQTAKAYKSFARANSYWNRRDANHFPALVEALAGLYADQVDYLTINKLGGMDNHWMVRARQVLAAVREGEK